MKTLSIQEQLHMEFPFPSFIDKSGDQKYPEQFDLLKEQSIKKSELITIAYKQWVKAYNAFNRFLEILHDFDCDFVENTFTPKFEGHTKNSALPPITDFYFADEINEYLAPILEQFNPNKNYFVRDDLQRIHEHLIATYVELEKQYRIYEKGQQGEEYVAQELEFIRGKYPYLQNIKFKYKDRIGVTSETDLYIITPKGILVCEIKNFGNENDLIHISKDGQWTKNPNSSYSEVISPSPFNQNTRHCVATESLLKANGIHDYRLIPVVIIANEVVHIQNDSPNAVIRASELYNLIETLSSENKYDRKYQDEIIQIFKENNDTEENYFPLKCWNDEASQAILEYTEELLQYMCDMHDFAATVRCNFKAKRTLGRTIRIHLPSWIFFGILIACILYFITNPDKLLLLICGFILIFLIWIFHIATS